MAAFSLRSKQRLATCDQRLQRLFEEVVKEQDCTILEGRRAAARQRELYLAGKSKIENGGKHTKDPSEAVDAAPRPINWEDTAGFERFGLLVLRTAKRLGIRVRWGGNWAGDWDGTGPRPKQRFDDLVHFEVI